jgi:hypothetical protein
MNIGRILIAAVLISLTASAVYAEIQSPEEYFGFPVDADRKLADYKEIREYLAELAAKSPWMNIETIGTTTLGRPFVMAVISTPENLTDLGRYKEISRRLADPRGLTEQGHPITYGMPDEGYIFFTRNPAFKTTIPFGKFGRTVLASYTDKQPLASGLLIGPEKLHRRAALVEMRYDKGKAVLFGFRPQHRCQTAGTYKLIFNALIEGGRI